MADINGQNNLTPIPDSQSVQTGAASTNQTTGGNAVLPTVPTSITSTNLTPQNPINVQQPANTPLPQVPTAPVTPALSETPSQQQESDLMQQIMALNTSSEGKSAAQSAAESAQGLPALQQTVKDLTARATALSDQALQIPLISQNQAQGRGITNAGLAPIEAAATRNNAIEALSVHTLLAAAQGNVAYAQSLADKAVAAQFDPITEKLNALTANLNLIKNDPQTTIDEKNQANAQLDSVKAQQAQIDQQKQDYSTGQAMAVAALKLNPNDPTAQFAAQQAMKLDPKDPQYLQKVTALVGKYQQDPNALAKAAADLALTKAQTAEAYSTVNKNNGSGSQDATTVSGWVTAIKNGTAKLSDITSSPGLKSAVAVALAQGGSTQSDMLQTTSSSLQELQDMVDNNKGFTGAVGIKSFTGAGGLVGSVGQFFGMKTQPLPGTAAADFVFKLNQVKNDIVLPNLNLLHGLGRVTDREFQALTSAVTSLNPDMSQSEFKTELKTITDRINQKMQDSGLNNNPVVKTGTLSDGTIVSQNADGSITDAQGNKYDANGNKLK